MENLEFLQDSTLQHTTLVEILLKKKVGQQLSETAIHSYMLLTYFLSYTSHKSRVLILQELHIFTQLP